MAEGATFARCPYCERWVDTDASDVVYAVKQHDLRGMGQAHDFVRGTGAFFHPRCPPEHVGYVRRPRPEN